VEPVVQTIETARRASETGLPARGDDLPGTRPRPIVVRVLGEGQLEVPAEEAEPLRHLDELLEHDLVTGDARAFARHLDAVMALVHVAGRPYDPEIPRPSDLILPPPDATLDEVRALLEAAP
jgi:hypothetical protein